MTIIDVYAIIFLSIWYWWVYKSIRKTVRIKNILETQAYIDINAEESMKIFGKCLMNRDEYSIVAELFFKHATEMQKEQYRENLDNENKSN